MIFFNIIMFPIPKNIKKIDTRILKDACSETCFFDVFMRFPYQQKVHIFWGMLHVIITFSHISNFSIVKISIQLRTPARFKQIWIDLNWKTQKKSSCDFASIFNGCFGRELFFALLYLYTCITKKHVLRESKKITSTFEGCLERQSIFYVFALIRHIQKNNTAPNASPILVKKQDFWLCIFWRMLRGGVGFLPFLFLLKNNKKSTQLRTPVKFQFFFVLFFNSR